MAAYNRQVAPGSECNAWQDFVAECHRNYFIAPWDDLAAITVVDSAFVGYWTVVAEGNSPDYDDAGSRVEA
jgi:hypothetical protein